MTAFLKFLALFGMLASAGGALLASVFSLAAAANSTPEQLRGVYLAIGVSIGLAAAGVGGGIYFLKSGNAGLAAIAAFAPLPLMVAGVFVFLK